jgi:hypothetical protein
MDFDPNVGRCPKQVEIRRGFDMVVKVGKIRSEAHSSFSRQEMNVALNLHWIGAANVCKYNESTGKIELVDHPKMSLLEDAQHHLCPNFVVKIEADLYSDGHVDNFRVVKD